MSKSFRDSASFGKRMEYKLIGDMLMEGLDCYVPLVDDHGVDCVIKKDDGKGHITYDETNYQEYEKFYIQKQYSGKI